MDRSCWGSYRNTWFLDKLSTSWPQLSHMQAFLFFWITACICITLKINCDLWPEIIILNGTKVITLNITIWYMVYVYTVHIRICWFISIYLSNISAIMWWISRRRPTRVALTLYSSLTTFIKHLLELTHTHTPASFLESHFFFKCCWIFRNLLSCLNMISSSKNTLSFFLYRKSFPSQHATLAAFAAVYISVSF